MSSDTPAVPPKLPPQTRGAATPHPGLARLNAAPDCVAESILLTCCGSHRWARRVAAHRPYPDLSALLAAADEAAYDLAAADLTEALAAEAGVIPAPAPSAACLAAAAATAHPMRTGTGAGLPGIATSAPPPRGSLAAHTALRAAHAAYEARFGHVFIVSVDGHDPDETLSTVLASIRARLGNDPDEERSVAAEELRRIARGRLAVLAGT
ncbi:2-oxo-4-hydroxy-4-carboxy-5-ureidoimidazoline decarboxylase, partial [Actinacidiphila oryziradicis]|uniref:2-oxo-4-hydroxy-4-carboxy-5-ureidoimidazoline decarboxylase n=1 Tax=Actinacidiphila oryziradicis TaxID=2571141 RepID=UPI0023EFE79A